MLKSFDIIIQNKYFVSNRGRKIIQNTGNMAFLWYFDLIFLKLLIFTNISPIPINH